MSIIVFTGTPLQLTVNLKWLEFFLKCMPEIN